ncbi:DUF938-like protein [Aureococcus anophagefferens]|nr:DUF938-like protein [Aureococcus anophagefferens]
MQRSPAFPRNKDPIAAAMEAAGFPDCGTILELGCGPGEHAPDFARRWPTPTFQPTDADASALRSSDAHAAAAGLSARGSAAAPSRPNVRGPTPRRAPTTAASPSTWSTSCRGPPWAPSSRAPRRRSGRAAFWESTIRGPSGSHAGPNNERFDESLRAQGYGGVASIEECNAAAAAAGLERRDVAYLPNNQS